MISPVGRQLLYSFGAFYVAGPLLGTFTSAFLYTHVSSPAALPLFNAALFTGLYVGFHVASWCGRWLRTSQLYGWGLLLQVLPTLAVVTFGVHDLTVLTIAGFSFGTLAGLYWAARAVLTSSLTTDGDRDLFFGVDSFLAIVSATVVPPLVGIGIQSSLGFDQLFSQEQAFALLLLLLVVLLIFNAFRMNSARHFDLPLRPRSRLGHTTPEWKLARRLIFFAGLGGPATSFLATSVTLDYFRRHDHLGFVQAVGSLLSGLVLYLLARYVARPNRRPWILLGAAILYAACSASIVVTPSPAAGLAFALGVTLALALLWNAVNPLVFGALDRAAVAGNERFPLILDRELYLNGGRVLGALLCTAIFLLVPGQLGLRYLLIFQSVILVVPIAMSFRLTRLHHDG